MVFLQEINVLLQTCTVCSELRSSCCTLQWTGGNDEVGNCWIPPLIGEFSHFNKKKEKKRLYELSWKYFREQYGVDIWRELLSVLFILLEKSVKKLFYLSMTKRGYNIKIRKNIKKWES